MTHLPTPFRGRPIGQTALALACVLGSAPGFAQERTSVAGGGNMSDFCGTKPTVVAVTDGYGGNTWRKTTLAEIRDEAASCKNITRILYANANGDQQKSNSDINSMVAQGANVLISFNDFGDGMLPALRKAQAAGVTVVPYFSRIGGAPGKDYSANVYQDQVYVGGLWAEWLGQQLQGRGNVLLLGGIPGAAVSQRFMDGFKEGLKKYPGLKLLDDNYIVTNWNPADAQKAVAGLIAKHGRIDGIASDYGVTTLAGIKAFEQAGLPIPAQATLASHNELNCKYLAARKEGKAWPYYSLDGTTRFGRFALRRAMANYQGVSNPEPSAVIPLTYIDSRRGLEPKCDAAAPPDADLSSSLPPGKLNALFKQ